MPDLVEQMYCSQQIHIPPTFPFILKQYCKAAIRTQPYDLLRWSATYFRCLATGQPPPVKPRLEYPPTDFPSGLSPGLLKILLKQFAGQKYVPARELYKIWHGICLEDKPLAQIFMLGKFENEVELLKFIAITAGYLTNRLSETMILICELLTEEPEGGSSMIPHKTFMELYEYLARMNCGPLEDWELSEPPLYTHDDRPDSPRQIESLDAIQILHTPECSQVGTPVASRQYLPEPASASQSSLIQGLGRCMSGDSLAREQARGPRAQEIQELFKEALWSALVQNLSQGAHIGMPERDEDQDQLKDEIWDSVVKALPGESSELDMSSLWSVIFNELPIEEEATSPEEGRRDKPSKSQYLKDAIWEALSKKMPPETMRETLWDALTQKIPDDLPHDLVKDELWNAILDKVPELKPKILEKSVEGLIPTPFGMKKPLPPKYQPGYVHASGEGPPPRIPGYAYPPGEEQVPGWVGTPRPQYRIHIKGIGPIVPDDQIEAVLEYLEYWSERQEEMIMPRNIRYFLCPPMDVAQTEEEEESASFKDDETRPPVEEEDDATVDSTTAAADAVSEAVSDAMELGKGGPGEDAASEAVSDAMEIAEAFKLGKDIASDAVSGAVETVDAAADAVSDAVATVTEAPMQQEESRKVLSAPGSDTPKPVKEEQAEEEQEPEQEEKEEEKAEEKEKEKAEEKKEEKAEEKKEEKAEEKEDSSWLTETLFG